MSRLDFTIPINKVALLSSNDEHYWVQNVTPLSSLSEELKKAKQAFSNEGPEFILDNFDIYFSVLHHGDKVNMETIQTALTDLHKVIQQLNNTLEMQLHDLEIAEEVRIKMLNILKMSMYLYSSIIVMMCNRIESNNKESLSLVAKGRRGKASKSKSSEEEMNPDDKKRSLLNLYKILQRPIHVLWDPPICEEMFINIISEICYTHLQCPFVKNEAEVKDLIFNVLGILLKNYNHSLTFIIRIVQLIKLKENEYFEAIVPNGIKILVENFNCQSLVRELVRELTEWQSNELADAAGTKHCSNILTEMTSLMPDLMIPEVIYLIKYLNHDAYTLRNCVLSIITEVIINVLSNEDLDDEKKEIRNQLLCELEMHILDTSAHVRSKVLQNWCRLQSEAAIPIAKQLDIMECVTERLKDKAVLVRKNAIILITAFLKHNPYAAILNMDKYEDDLNKAKEKYLNLKGELMQVHLENIKEKEEQWVKMEGKLREIVTKKLAEGIEEGAPMDIDADVPTDNLAELIKTYLTSEDYENAFIICHGTINQFKDLAVARDDIESADEVEFFMTFLYSIFMDMQKNAAALVEKELNKVQLSQEQMEELEKAQREMLYIQDVYNFLEKIDKVIPHMIQLLHSSVINDVVEAIEFFVVAHQFQIKNSYEGLISMMKIMNSKEPDRRKAVIEAYKTIFLTTDNRNSKEGNLEIIRTLINLLKNSQLSNLNDLTLIISEWVQNGDINNEIIKCLWHCYTQQIPEISDEDSKAALQLLVMAAKGRKSIVERNLDLIVETAFGEKGMNDLQLVIIACKMLTLMGNEVITESSTNPPFRISEEDAMWDQLLKIVIDNYDKNINLYPDLLTTVVNLLFKVCNNPEKICEQLIKDILTRIYDPELKILENEQIDPQRLANFIHLLGEVAIKYFVYLDTTVYTELKRRKFILERRTANKAGKADKQQKNVSMNNSVMSASSRRSIAGKSDNINIDGESEDANPEGTTADDRECLFILDICENKVVINNLLGDFAPFLKYILKNHQKYDHEDLQTSATLAFLRFMCVSSIFCAENIQLIMTILERTPYISVKINILISVADLLTRFPNTIEPWSSLLYKKVHDDNDEVRLTAMRLVTNLIVQDMLRAKGNNVADIALCIVDNKSKLMKEIAKSFFFALAKKGNTIYNILPDVISCLSAADSPVEEKTFREVISFLINLIDKDRIVEPLVEKLCLRFPISETARHWRDIAFCLSLLNYNEKGLDRLAENYMNYKICLEEDEVYQFFNQIIQKTKNSSKEEIQNASNKLENILKNGQEVVNTENAEAAEVFKQPKPRKTKRTRK